MSSTPEKRAEEMLNKLRKLKGLGPLTPAEADAEYAAAPSESLSDDEIASIVESVVSGERASWEPVPDLDWADEMDLEEVESEALQLYRNKGEDDDEATSTEADLREELLNDGDDTENEDGMDGDAASPSSGGK